MTKKKEKKIDKSFRAVEAYNSKFKIGQRVRINTISVRSEDRNCVTGTIIAATTRFPVSPKFRKIFYTVRLDGFLVKKEKVIYDNLDEIRVDENHLEALEDDE